MNPYEVLSSHCGGRGTTKLGPHSSEREIKMIYHSLALKFHPDKVGNLEGDIRFLEIAKAYECLSSPSSRLLVDNVIRVEEERKTFLKGKDQKWKEMRDELLESEFRGVQDVMVKEEHHQRRHEDMKGELENSLLFIADSVQSDVEFKEMFGYLPTNLIILPSLNKKNQCTIEGICQFKNRKTVDLVMKSVMLIGDDDEFYKLFKPFRSITRVLCDSIPKHNLYDPFSTFEEIESDTLSRFSEYIAKKQ